MLYYNNRNDLAILGMESRLLLVTYVDLDTMVGVL